MIRRTVLVVLLACLVIFPLSGAPAESGNAAAAGVNGYLVIPSAVPAWAENDGTVTIGYSANLSGNGFSHIPYLQVGVNGQLEFALSADLGTGAAILFNGKLRVDRATGRSLAFGVNGQLLQITPSLDWAAQLYGAYTFSGNILNRSASATLMLGYTLRPSISSNIDYGMGLEFPFLEDVFNGKVDFVLDFGNISYSAAPSITDAGNRGMVNLGLRLRPITLTDGIYFSADLRTLDIMDAADRGLSLGVGFSFEP